MKKGFALLLLSILIIIFSGCGNTEQPTKKAPQSDTDSNVKQSGGIVAGSVVPSLSWQQSDGRIKLIFHLKNQTERIVHYHFNTDERWDFTIETADGDIIYQLSKQHNYESNGDIITLKQGDEIEFADEIKSLPQGEYLVKAWLTSNEEGPQIEKRITIGK